MIKKALSLFLFPYASAFSLYLGNPASPDAIDKGMVISDDSFATFRLGYQADVIFDKQLKSHGKACSAIDEFNAVLNQGVITAVLVDRVEAYASVGGMKAVFCHRPNPGHFRRGYRTHDNLTCGVGGRAILFEWGGTADSDDGKSYIGMEGGYQWAWNTIEGASRSNHGKMRYHEWQVGLGISHVIDIFIPYGAVKYSNVHATVTGLDRELHIPHRRFKMSSEDHWGLVLGCTLTSGKFLSVNIESRVIDENALTFSGDLKF